MLMKFAHSLPLPHTFCRLVDYHPDWSVSDLILFSSEKETRALRPSVLVLPSGLFSSKGLAVGGRDLCPHNFSLLAKKIKNKNKKQQNL